MTVYLYIHYGDPDAAGPTVLRLFDEVAPFVVGRSPDAQLPLHAGAVSRRHAEVRVRNGRVALRDIGSTNGIHRPPHHRLQPFVWLDLPSHRPVELSGYFLSQRDEPPAAADPLAFLPGPGVQGRLHEIETLLTTKSSPLVRRASWAPLPPLAEHLGPDWSRWGSAHPPVDCRVRLLLDHAADAIGRDPEPLTDLLRDLLGDAAVGEPLCPTVAAWRDGLVGCMARAIHQEQTYHDLPILADALEEAGCDQPDVLAHLRGGGPHYPGCWAVRWLTARPQLVPAIQ